MLKIKLNIDTDNFLFDKIEWVPLETDNNNIARDFPREENDWAFFENEYNESIIEERPENHKLVVCGIYIYDKDEQKMFKKVLLIITPESSRHDKWFFEGAQVEVEDGTILDMDTSRPYNQDEALKEAWEEGYSFAKRYLLEDSEYLYNYLARQMIEYEDIQSRNPTKSTFEQWLMENIISGAGPDTFIDGDQFGEYESDACPARDKYYDFLDLSDISGAFYTGGDQALEDYLKENSIPKQEEWRDEYDELREWRDKRKNN